MKRLGLVTALLIGVAAAPRVHADEEFDTLEQEYGAAEQAWAEQTQEAQSVEGIADTEELPPHPAKTFLPRFKAYAEKHAGRPEAIPALAWLISSAGVGNALGESDPTATWAVERLAKEHAAQSAIGRALPGLRYAMYQVGSEPLIALYERVIEVNKDKDALGWAMFNLAFTLYHGGPTPKPEKEAVADTQRAEKYFRRCVKEHPGTDAAESAASYIYEIEHLQIGMQAPEIVGTDVNGKEIKLSQLRGQIVVLDFWGFW